jgi:uncharacterized protein (TIGR03643 family)
MNKKKLLEFIKKLNEQDKSRIIRSALQDDIPFESIKTEYYLTENDVVYLMKKLLPLNKYIAWRRRARGSELKNSKRTKLKDEF